MAKDNAPVRPPWHERRLKTVSRKRIFEVEPGGAVFAHAVLVQEDRIRNLRRMKVVPFAIAEGRLSWRPAECWLLDGY